MSSVLQQLHAGRQVTSMRIALECSTTATSIRQGPAVQAGTGPAWLAHLCPAHTEDLPGWPGAATVAVDGGRLHCGVVLDYRPTEQVLQSHADLWLTPLTGVDPKTLKHFWYDVLAQSNRVVLARLEEDGGGEDGPLQSFAMMLGMAVQNASEGNLFQALVPLAYCETVSQELLPQPGLAPQ
ncbi:hypothetical protein [Streptomyces sp. IBSBF 2950]|uniref:hypothetical protein n=1 Tax=Streptomyces sp. IBSBF 2950 TaxID=2903528 RepID=UPI002FDC0099